MRAELAKRDGLRQTFHGVFVRLGQKSGWGGTTDLTILLQHIQDPEGHAITDHLWFAYTKGFRRANLQPGDHVQFDARVTGYEKGYQGQRDDVYQPGGRDYKLSFPTKIQKLVQS